MRARLLPLLLAASLWPAIAHAASDKPVMAPPPDWVKPVALSAGTGAKEGDEAPVRLLLSDQQVRFEAGKEISYTDIALRIQTPQGLSAGNLSLPWNPETNVLTVHKLLIHRDGTTIDVLAAGQTFTVVRREPNLENAMLDGVLTANIQPEGLQVGDILEFAVSVTSSDPVLKGHVEEFGAAWNGLPIDQAHFKLSWPSDLPVAMRQSASLPPVKPVKAGGFTTVELSLDKIEPIIPPRGAPARFALGRILEFSDFRSWADLGALMAPLYDKASAIPAEGPLRAEVDKIKAASSDPVARAQAALALVQDRVRYVALLMGAGGLRPAGAAETWGRRYGDCKAKTALLLGLLRELGVAAEPVAANIISGDGLDERLPMVGLFNHVLVRAHIAGKDYWLDGTRSGDTSLARLRVPDFGWGLPLVAKGAALVRMLPAVLAEPDFDIAIDLDAREGLSLPAALKAQVVLRGDAALGTRLALAGQTADIRDKTLRDYWKSQLDDIEITSVDAAYDAATGSETLTVQGKANMDWTDGQYWTDWTRVGYEADFSRAAGADADAPFAITYPMYSRSVETIRLPPGFTEQNIFRRDPIDETVAGIEYRRKSSLTDNVFRIERTMRATGPEFAAKDAPAAQKRLKELHNLRVAVRRPANYRMTTTEVDAELGKAGPNSVDRFLWRGGQLTLRKRYEEAMLAFEGALELDPLNVRAKFGKLGVLFYAGKSDEALKFAKSIDIASIKEANLATILATTFFGSGDHEGALRALDHWLGLKPDDAKALAMRSEVNWRLGKTDEALADGAASLKIDPKQPNVYLMRSNVFRQRGENADGVREADALLAANPDDGYAHVVAARILGGFGEQARARAVIDRAVALNPDAIAYLNRIDLRAKSDLDGRQADLDAALRLEPDSVDAIRMKAQLQVERQDYTGAVKSYSILIEKFPDSSGFLNSRGIAYSKAGDAKNAAADFAAARSKSTSPSRLNELCFAKAMAGVALDRALDECEAALKTEPDAPGILDSRAFVLLRLGRLDEAIAAYDRALAKAPNLAASLYGRAIARTRKGDAPGAQADLVAARKANPGIADEYAGYGVTP